MRGNTPTLTAGKGADGGNICFSYSAGVISVVSQ